MSDSSDAATTASATRVKTRSAAAPCPRMRTRVWTLVLTSLVLAAPAFGSVPCIGGGFPVSTASRRLEGLRRQFVEAGAVERRAARGEARAAAVGRAEELGQRGVQLVLAGVVALAGEGLAEAQLLRGAREAEDRRVPDVVVRSRFVMPVAAVPQSDGVLAAAARRARFVGAAGAGIVEQCAAQTRRHVARFMDAVCMSMHRIDDGLSAVGVRKLPDRLGQHEYRLRRQLD